MGQVEADGGDVAALHRLDRDVAFHEDRLVVDIVFQAGIGHSLCRAGQGRDTARSSRSRRRGSSFL